MGVECDACERPATHLNYRVAERTSTTPTVSLRTCELHNRLAFEYKPLLQGVEKLKKEEWLAEATKKQSHDVGRQLMESGRDNTYRSRRLSYNELHRDDRGLERPGFSR